MQEAFRKSTKISNFTSFPHKATVSDSLFTYCFTTQPLAGLRILKYTPPVTDISDVQTNVMSLTIRNWYSIHPVDTRWAKKKKKCFGSIKFFWCSQLRPSIVILRKIATFLIIQYCSKKKIIYTVCIWETMLLSGDAFKNNMESASTNVWKSKYCI